MADGDGGDAPLRLRRLAGIVDDEGVDDGHRAEKRAGSAGFGKRRGLAGQPFERAMRAEMDQRIDARLLPEPEIEGDVRMPRRQVRIVIGGFAVCHVAPLGLQADQKIAMGGYRQGNRAAGERRVVLRRAPGGCNGIAQGFRQAGKRGFVLGEGPFNFTGAVPPHPVPLPMGEGTPSQRARPAPSPMGRGLG